MTATASSAHPTKQHTPTRVIRTAVIGFGTSGRVFHAPFLRTDPRYSLDAIVTGDAGRRAKAGEEHPTASIFSTTEEMFQATEGELDLVVIGSPPGSHVGLAEEALDRRVAVVIDKPLCVTAGEGRALIERADKLRVPLTVFQNRRWDGDYLTVRELVRSGALGDVRRFESRFEWWKPEETKAWKRESTIAEGGGILYDLGTHLIDQAIHLLGPVEDVHAELASHRRAGVDDDSFVSLLHRSGVRSQLWMNGMAAQVGPRFHVLGSVAGYTKWGLDGQESALQAGALPTDAGYGTEPESTWGMLGVDGALEPVPTQPGRYTAFYALLADALLNGGPLPVDPRDALAVIEIIENIHSTFGPCR